MLTEIEKKALKLAKNKSVHSLEELKGVLRKSPINVTISEMPCFIAEKLAFG